MSYLYNNAKKLFLAGTYGFASTTIKVMLVTSAYTPDPDHVYVYSATAYELSGTGYAGTYGGSGRKTLASKTVTVDNTLDRGVCDAANVTWTALTAGTVAAAILVIETGGSDATSLLVEYCDLPRFVTDGTDYTITWPDSGVLYLA